LGGNLQNASPSGDGILALMLLGASLILRSLKGKREVYVEDFILGPGRTVLEKDEFIECIVIKKSFADFSHYFEKVGLRNAMIIAVASMGILLKLQENRIVDVRIGFGAVAPTAVRAKVCESFMKGKILNEELLEAAGEIIVNEISPIDDLRASAEYRKKVCRNLLKRLLQ
jgi:CO/xanthine dehydrogenase FAD-binding subunit